ncbi:MAG: YfiR family protein [Thiobacillus sp.]|nr:YfiR family protein [Thiobacillus sp.]
MTPALATDGAEDETLLKTAFVYNFAKFTRWPGKAMDEQVESLSLCIAGEDNLAEGLWRLRGRPVKGQPLAVLAVREARLPKTCNILYVAASEQPQLPDYLRATRGQAILTVAQFGRFAQDGGMIELYREHGRVRFIINLGAARAAGLEINPSLLSLAVVIGQD